jgi:hypothetical protein
MKNKFAKFVSIKKKSNTNRCVRYLSYAVRCFFPTNPGNTSAEICEKQQGKKSAKNLCLALAAKEANTERILFIMQARSGL